MLWSHIIFLELVLSIAGVINKVQELIELRSSIQEGFMVFRTEACVYESGEGIRYYL
jgi:hypothetical protein